MIHLPGVIEIEGQYNVLVMTVEPEGRQNIVLHLMFVDPNQYEALKNKSEDSAETDGESEA